MCVFTNCLARGATQEQSGEEKRAAPGGGPAGRGTGGVQEAKGCPLEEGPSSGCVREICVKSGAKANSWGAFVIKVPPGATHWIRDPLLGTGVASHQRAQLDPSRQNMC